MRRGDHRQRTSGNDCRIMESLLAEGWIVRSVEEKYGFVAPPAAE
jgi:hypothetical protein